MSRNGSGTYNLPAGNPVVTGTTITTTWANTTLNDIASSLTGSVASDGQTPMTGSLNMANNKITDVTDPTNAQDAATKAYADALITGSKTGVFTSVTDSGLTSGRVTYATTAGLLTDSANLTFNGTALTLANDASISGLTVGKGGGAVASNTAVGVQALGNGSTTGSGNTALGSYQASVASAPLVSNTTGTWNIAIGTGSLASNTTGNSNTSVGVQSLNANTTASNNTAVGYQAGYYITTGAKNTIVGGYNGNQGSLDIRTSSNNIVLSDGDGNPRQVINSSGALGLNGANYGTAGQVLTSQGSSAVPTWTNAAGIVAGTAQASTSGTSIDFTSIPSGVKRITVMFSAVSTNGSSYPLIQIGTSGGLQTTGYVSDCGGTVTGSGALAGPNATTGYIVFNAGNSSASISGSFVLALVDSATGLWVENGVGRWTSQGVGYSAGTKTLSGTLDRVRITTVNGTDTFDAGSVNILYE